jgi:hypothetical protein
MTFIGLTFAHDNWQVGTYGLGEQQGQPNVSANVTVYHSQRITFQNDTFAHTMGKGIDIQVRVGLLFPHSPSTLLKVFWHSRRRTQSKS